MKRIVHPALKKPDLSKIIAFFLAAERAHNLLVSYVPAYSHWIDTIIDKLKRKIRLRSTLLDDMHRYIAVEGTIDDTVENYVKVRDKAQQDYLFTLLEKHCELTKMFSMTKEFFDTVDNFGFYDACEQTDLPEATQLRDSSRVLFSKVAGVTYSKSEDVKPELSEFLSSVSGFWIPSGLYFMKYQGTPFVCLMTHRLDFSAKVEDEDREFCLFFAKKDEEKCDEFIDLISKELEKFNPYACSVLSDFSYRSGGSTGFRYDEQQTLELRLREHKFNMSFYNENVRQAVAEDIIPFIKIMTEPGDARRSYMLAGPPGCGKTQLIRHVVSLLPKEFTAAIIDSDGIDSLSEINTDLLFIKPLCVIVEDIDLIMESSGQKQELLNFLDGISSRQQMLTVMTANKPKALGHVFMRRPGRIDRVIKVLPGDLQERVEQLKYLTHKFEIPVDLHHLAKMSDGFSFAQHREVVQRSRLYSGGSKFIKAKVVKAFEECREQFTTAGTEDWSDLVIPELPDDIPVDDDGEEESYE